MRTSAKIKNVNPLGGGRFSLVSNQFCNPLPVMSRKSQRYNKHIEKHENKEGPFHNTRFKNAIG